MNKWEGYLMLASLFVQGTALSALALTLKLRCTTSLPLLGLVLLYALFAASCLVAVNWWRQVGVK